MTPALASSAWTRSRGGRRAFVTAVLLSGGVLSSGLVAAQSPVAKPAPPPVVPAEPGVTTASYGDWVLRCQRLTTGEKAGRLCEVSQAMQVQGQAAPIALLAIGRLPGETDLRVTALLPVTVSFPSSVRVAPDDKDVRDSKSGSLELVWRRCLPGGCMADGVTKDEGPKRWRDAEQPGHLVFRDGSGQEVAIPVSWRGLGPALDALARERS